MSLIVAAGNDDEEKTDVDVIFLPVDLCVLLALMHRMLIFCLLAG